MVTKEDIIEAVQDATDSETNITSIPALSNLLDSMMNEKAKTPVNFCTMQEQNLEDKDRALHIADVVPMLKKIAACIDEAVESTNNDNEGEWDKICTAVELLNAIAEDNSMFIRN
jgi:hypothetical protein